MSDSVEDFRADVYSVVADGEQAFLTRDEIAGVLRDVAEDIETTHE